MDRNEIESTLVGCDAVFGQRHGDETGIERLTFMLSGERAIRCRKSLDRIHCTPLRIEQSVLQEVVVPARPIPSFPLSPLLQKPERLE